MRFKTPSAGWTTQKGHPTPVRRATASVGPLWGILGDGSDLQSTHLPVFSGRGSTHIPQTPIIFNDLTVSHKYFTQEALRYLVALHSPGARIRNVFGKLCGARLVATLLRMKDICNFTGNISNFGDETMKMSDASPGQSASELVLKRIAER